MIEILPYSLVRYASLPVGAFAPFHLAGLEQRLQRIHKMHDERSLLQTAICDRLYELVQTAPGDTERINLIRLKRVIYNNKTISVQLLTDCSPLLPPALQVQLRKLFDLITAIDIAESNQETHYQQHLSNSHRHLQQLAGNPLLQNGLLLSSPVLYSQLPDYISKDPKDFGPKEWRLIFSLLRYLTRMTFKTSPFSSFTYTGQAQFIDPHNAIFDSANPSIRSGIRLHNGLFEYIKSILNQHPVLNEYLLVRLNNTVRLEENKLSFLFNHHNIESFQKLPAVGLQRYILEQLRTAGTSNMTFSALIQKLEPVVAPADRRQLKKHLMQLVDTGFLELSTDISAMDHHWSQALLRFLSATSCDHPDLKLLVQLLENLDKVQAAYPEANVMQRKELLEVAEKEVNSSLKQLQAETGAAGTAITAISATAPFKKTNPGPLHFSGRQLIYEDCYTDTTDRLSEAAVRQFIEKTDTLLQYLRPMEAMAPEREKMLSFFKQHYPVRASVNILDFYFDYYSNVKKQEKEAAPPQLTNSGPWIENLDRHLKEIVVPGQDILDLDAHFFDAMSQAQNGHQKTGYSRGVFVQFYPESGDKASESTLIGVINAVLPGMGKVSGRFLHLFPPAMSDSIRSHNERLHPDLLKAELSDGSFFNANIHPPLLFQECSLSDEHRHYPPERQIPVHELSVCHTEGEDFLSLFYQGQEVFAYDLCLESFYNRSNFYQLMAHFNSDDKVYLQPFINCIDRQYLPQDPATLPLILLPRIVYAETVIIRRKTWCVQRRVIPAPQGTETAAQYFVRLNSWRVDAGIPAAVFLFLRKRSFAIEEVVKGHQAQKLLPDDYKPQYISFEQPILVDLFVRLLARAGQYLILEEVLPTLDPTAGPAQDQVKEHLIQWYNY